MSSNKEEGGGGGGIREGQHEPAGQSADDTHHRGDGNGGDTLGGGHASQEDDGLDALPEHGGEAQKEDGPVGALAPLLLLLQARKTMSKPPSSNGIFKDDGVCFEWYHWPMQLMSQTACISHTRMIEFTSKHVQ